MIKPGMDEVPAVADALGSPKTLDILNTHAASAVFGKPVLEHYQGVWAEKRFLKCKSIKLGSLCHNS